MSNRYLQQPRYAPHFYFWVDDCQGNEKYFVAYLAECLDLQRFGRYV